MTMDISLGDAVRLVRLRRSTMPTKRLASCSNPHITGWATGPFCKRNERPTLLALQFCADLRKRQISVGTALLDLTHRHRLDKRKVETLLMCPGDLVDDLRLVDSF